MHWASLYRSPSRHEGACCVGTSSSSISRGGLLRVSETPLLPPSAVCGSRNASMFPTELPQRTVPDVSETSPGLRWCKVEWGGVGDLLFLEYHLQPRTQISQHQSYSVSFCLYQVQLLLSVESCVLSQCPLEASANYRIYNLSFATAL